MQKPQFRLVVSLLLRSCWAGLEGGQGINMQLVESYIFLTAGKCVALWLLGWSGRWPEWYSAFAIVLNDY